MNKYKTLFTFFLILSGLRAVGQSDEVLNSASGMSLTVNEYGEVFTCGQYEGSAGFGRHTLVSKGESDIFLSKYNKKGECVWAISCGGKGNDCAQAISIDRNNYIYITGYFSEECRFDYQKIKSAGAADAFIAKFNPSGRLMWIKVIGGEGEDIGVGLVVDSNGNIDMCGNYNYPALCGKIKLNGTIGKNILLAKFAPSGKMLWHKTFHGGGQIASAITADKHNNIILTGSFDKTIKFSNTTLESQGNTDVFTVKLSSGGSVQWAKSYESTNNDNMSNAVTVGTKGNIVVGGKSASFESEEHCNLLLLEYGANGQRLAERIYSCGQIGAINGVSISREGNIYTTGEFLEYIELDNCLDNSYFLTPFIAIFNNAAHCKWIASFESGGPSNGTGIVLDRNDNCYFMGSYRGAVKFGNLGLSSANTDNTYIVKMISGQRFAWATKAGEPDPLFGYDPSATYVNYHGELLTGKEEKQPLKEAPVVLLDSAGQFVDSTITDYYGDFSFYSLNTKNEFHLKVKVKKDSVDAPVYLANQKGVIITQLFNNSDGFDYKILPKELIEINLMEEQDVTMKLDDFLKSEDKEKTISDIVYYKTGQWQIPPGYKKTLLDMVRRMKRVPTLKLEVMSYTDSRGEANNNMLLSQKRADAIVSFITARHIEATRISGKGYGESKLLNRCSDGVECSEQEHQANRRTEFRFYRK